ncbi:MAG: glutamate 5-kinase, partial [Dehalococcoidales bacterium]
ALLDLKVVCIVNENDTVAVDELQDTKFGDNDSLSAMVANLVDADMLVMLTDTDGLYTDDPRRCADACLVPQVARIDRSIERLAMGSHDGLGTGGMITKIEAAKLATACGVRVVVANGNKPDIILNLVRGGTEGTHFLPVSAELDSRQRWMLSGLSTRGQLIVDDGAAAALKKQHRSLLAAGIKEVQGKVRRGDIVNIYDSEGNLLGCGLTNYAAADIGVIKGANSGKIAGLLGYDYGSEVVHRNNMVVLQLSGEKGRQDAIKGTG